MSEEKEIHSSREIHSPREIRPMKIWQFPSGKEDEAFAAMESGKYFGQCKKDGYLATFEKDSNGEMHLFSRTVSVKTGHLSDKIDHVPHIKEALDCLPNDTIIVGELYYPGGSSKDVTTIMGCLAPKAIDRQIHNPLHFYVHDLLYFNGESYINRGALERYRKLEDIYYNFGLDKYNNFLELAQCYLDNLSTVLFDLLSKGEEGMVFKKKDAPYSPDKRPARATFKVKQKVTVDAVIMGFEDATKLYSGKELNKWQYWEVNGVKVKGELYSDYLLKPSTIIPVTKPYFYGWKTAIKIGAYDNDKLVSIGTVSSGLTDELREKFAASENFWYNKVIEIEGMSLNVKDRSVRHGRFKCFRDDKNPTDCKLNELF